jgi:fructose-1,6-bisphosphatase I
MGSQSRLTLLSYSVLFSRHASRLHLLSVLHVCILNCIPVSCTMSSLFLFIDTALENVTGLAGTKNSMGEDVKQLDVISNDFFIDSLTNCERVCAMVSEENGEVIQVPKHLRNGPYIVAFDPLDGSSNIDVAVPVGSIFAIYKRTTAADQEVDLEKDVLQCGSKSIICSGYALYGSCTTIIVATENGVNGYTLDPVSGEFERSHSQLKIPKRGNIYSVNEGNEKTWTKSTKIYVQEKKGDKEKGLSPYSLRYVGSMVADIHRTLLKGGIFFYPADQKSPEGKLRLLYECNPMSYIMEKAGGKAMIGHKEGRVLDFKPKSIHQRVPIYLGSSDDVDDILKIMAEVEK